MIDGLHKIEQALGIADAVVVFDAEENAVLGRVIAAFAEALDGPAIGLRTVYSLGFAPGKHTNVWCAEHCSVIDPLLHVGYLRLAGLTGGQGKIVAHGRAAYFHST